MNKVILQVVNPGAFNEGNFVLIEFRKDLRF